MLIHDDNDANISDSQMSQIPLDSETVITS